MGFNALQPGRVKRAALAVVVGLIVWAIWG
jgi:hypothetical protein